MNFHTNDLKDSKKCLFQSINTIYLSLDYYITCLAFLRKWQGMQKVKIKGNKQTKKANCQYSQETKIQSEPDSDTTQMLELSEREFKNSYG